MKYSIIALIGFFLFSACELTDVVDPDPPNHLVDENVITDEESARELLNGAYAALHDQFYYMHSETTPSLLSGSVDQNGFSADAALATNSVTAENNSVDSHWQAFYKLMDASNTAIDLIGEQPDEDFTGNNKQEFIAEARFLRAMSLFDALRYYGQFYDLDSPLGVVIRTEPVDFTTRDADRSSVQEVYDQIIEDLDAAIENAPELSDPYYASQTAAKAMKARVLLYMGEYADAATLADEVITDNTRSLAPTFAEVFSTGFSSEEMIFMRHSDEATEAAPGGDRKQFMYDDDVLASEWLEGLMDQDPRETVTYDEDGIPLKVNTTEFYSPTYFMRLAEIYLIKAEALARSEASLDEAKAPFEEVKSRALETDYESEATTHEELLDEIFEEIVRELVLENGADWFAAIRFDKIQEIKEEVTGENQYILPIPKSEMDGNTLLDEQNPGYN